MSGLASDYLFLSALIQARLQAELGPDCPPLDGIEALAQAGAADKRPAVIYVMWDGDRFNSTDTGRAGAGASQIVTQRWMVLLYVQNASQVVREARNRIAGPLLSQIHKAIAGWQPAGVARKFVRASGARPDYQATSGLYPLTFEITLTL